MNRERMETFRALQARLVPARDLAAVIVEENGAPALQIVRVDSSKALLVTMIYHTGDWRLSAGNIVFARASQIDRAAHILWRAMQ